MNLFFKPFSELTNIELYHILKLRSDVFVVEQDCPYPELDGKDLNAIHVTGMVKGDIVAVARVLPPGVSYTEWSFGRIATHKKFRGRGLGRQLIASMMLYMTEKFPNQNVRISAQEHLKEFYNEFGFKSTGKKYLEDGIPHIEMLYEAKSN